MTSEEAKDYIREWCPYDRQEEIIEAFSAQETVTEFADRCRECGSMIGRQMKRKTGRWIPVSEGLPEDGTWNLFTDGKKVSVERYKSDALDHFYPNGRWFSLEEVVAWMPLPEPYEPQESEDK